MKKKLHSPARVFSGIIAKWSWAFACLSILIGTGFSLIGFGIGSAIDATNKKEMTITVQVLILK